MLFAYLFCLLCVIVIDNFRDPRLQIFKRLYTVIESELLKFVFPDDQFALLQDLFTRGPTQFQLPEIVQP